MKYLRAKTTAHVTFGLWFKQIPEPSHYKFTQAFDVKDPSSHSKSDVEFNEQSWVGKINSSFGDFGVLQYFYKSNRSSENGSANLTWKNQ